MRRGDDAQADVRHVATELGEAGHGGKPLDLGLVLFEWGQLREATSKEADGRTGLTGVTGTSCCWYHLSTMFPYLLLSADAPTTANLLAAKN